MKKRNVQGKAATVFDLLESVGPCVIKPKILLQELRTRGYDWDDVIHAEIASRNGSWDGQLRGLCNGRGLDVCVKKVVPDRVITSFFVDALPQAYGNDVYLQCVYNDATVSSWLVASKGKVAPLKLATVPRLELAGAVLGLPLTRHSTLALGLPMRPVTFYSGSKGVLWWIRGLGRAFASSCG